MKKKIYANARFIPRRKTLAEWETENPVLLAGEHGFVTDATNGEREKIGDGVTRWNNLEWWKGLSAYEIAVKKGFDGTEEEWLASLKGEKGDDAGINVYSGNEISIPNGMTIIKTVLIAGDSIFTKVNMGDIYINTDESIVYQCLAVRVSNGMKHSTWTGLNCPVDLSNYYTKDETDKKIGEATALVDDFSADIANLYNVKADKEYVDGLVGDIETLLGGI